MPIDCDLIQARHGSTPTRGYFYVRGMIEDVSGDELGHLNNLTLATVREDAWALLQCRGNRPDAGGLEF